MRSSSLFSSLATILLAGSARAHLYVWSVYVNGVDQGTGYGIRSPPYNGPPLAGTNPFGQGSGYANWPFKDVDSIDYRCGALGDIQDSNTIDVVPGDVLTFDWHHESRLASDDIIASSHAGACVIYLSPDPPKDNSWVKIQESGEYAKGKWCSTDYLIGAKGKLNTRIPAGLAPGKYLIRPELITLHEAEVTWPNNKDRGAQLYFQCVQLNVKGSGTTTLPAGVSFPGAHKFDDPGMYYNVYYTSPSAPAYKIPGPTVWSGAYPSPAPPAYGAQKGPLTALRWSSWINGLTTSVVIVQTATSGLKTTTHVPKWSTSYQTPTAPPTTAPTTTSAPGSTTTTASQTTTTAPPATTTVPSGTVPQWGQCGGIGWTGPTKCASPFTCRTVNDWYFQCQ